MTRTGIMLIISLLLNGLVTAQDYEIVYKYDDGFSSVRKSRTVYAVSKYSNNTTVVRYGLIDKNKKLVLPIIYKSVFSALEPGLYRVKDTLKENEGLFSATEGRFIVEPKYYEMEGFREGLAVVKAKTANDFVWGAINTKGQEIIPVKYEYLGSSYEGLLNFQPNDERRFGYIDQNNNIVIPATYSNISHFNNGLAPAQTKSDGLYGYINRKNEWVVPEKYVDAESFFEGYAEVSRKKSYTPRNSSTIDGEKALIDKTGKEITGFDYSHISLRNKGGLFIVTKDKKSGVIDSTGKTILPLNYSLVLISEGGNIIHKTPDSKYGMSNVKGQLLMKQEYDYISSQSGSLISASKKGWAVVMDQNLKVLIPADSASVIVGKNKILYKYNDKIKIYDLNGKLLRTVSQFNISPNLSGFASNEDSLKVRYDATVELINLGTGAKKALPYSETSGFNDEGTFMVRRISYNYYDINGKKLSPVEYYTGHNFSEGLAAAQLTSTSAPYLMDKQFKKIKDIPSGFKGPYSEGLAMVKETGSSIAYLNTKGEKVFSVNGSEAGAFENGRAWIKNNYGLYFYVDKTGKAMGTKTWNSMREFSDGLAAVNEYSKWGYIDNEGKLVISNQFEEAASFTQGTAVVKLLGKYLLINKQGLAINANRYEGAGNPGNGYFPLMKGTLVGLVDSKGATVIDFKYNNVLPLHEDRTWAAKNGKWALLDGKGKELTGFIYDGGGEFKNGYAIVLLNNKYGLVDKAGKLVVPATYINIGSVLKNNVLAIKGEGTVMYSLK